MVIGIVAIPVAVVEPVSWVAEWPDTTSLVPEQEAKLSYYPNLLTVTYIPVWSCAEYRTLA